jgi:hypothetical protein
MMADYGETWGHDRTGGHGFSDVEEGLLPYPVPDTAAKTRHRRLLPFRRKEYPYLIFHDKFRNNYLRQRDLQDYLAYIATIKIIS